MSLYPPLIAPRQAPRRHRSVIHAKVSKEVRECASRLRRKFAALFAADPRLRRSVGRLIERQLPPRGRRRGRPGYPEVTRALRLFAGFRRTHPGEPAQGLWALVYPAVIEGHGTMSPVERRDAEQQLRERVRWRRRSRRRARRMRGRRKNAV
jgi:hypothetical protein